MWSLSRMGWYMVVRMCGWNGVLSGVLAACVMVCAVRAVVSRSVLCPVGVPCVGLLVHRRAPWCKISQFHLHLVLDIAHLMGVLVVALFPYIVSYVRKSVFFLCSCSLGQVRVRIRVSICVEVGGIVWPLGACGGGISWLVGVSKACQRSCLGR